MLLDKLSNRLFSPKNDKMSFFLTKIGLGILMVIFFSCNSVNLFPFQFHPEEPFNCIYDRSFKLSSSINRFIQNTSWLKNFLIIYSSLLMDLQFFFIMISFCSLARNFRFALIFIIFYLIRGILQSIFVFSFPHDYIWGHPGFFSLTISYAKTSDFFYSGHVGSSVLCCLEFSRYEFFNKNFVYLKYFSFNCCITQSLIQIIFRGHYLIDVICGVIFAHYFFILIDSFMPDDIQIFVNEIKKDQKAIGKIFRKKCLKCKKK